MHILHMTLYKKNQYDYIIIILQDDILIYIVIVKLQLLKVVYNH